MARDLAGMDALVVGVDIIHYLKALEASGETCSYPASDFEALSQFVQKDLAYPALRDAGAGRLLVRRDAGLRGPGAGAGHHVPRRDQPRLLPRPAADQADLPRQRADLGAGTARQGRQLRAGHAPRDAVDRAAGDDRPGVRPRLDRGVRGADARGARSSMLPKVGHGYSVPKNWLPQFREAFRKVLAAPSADPTRQ